jgi:hypothetical protein
MKLYGEYCRDTECSIPRNKLLGSPLPVVGERDYCSTQPLKLSSAHKKPVNFSSVIPYMVIILIN